MIVDTSVLLALFNSREAKHEAVAGSFASQAGEPLVISPYVVAELDYLVTTRVGVEAELAVLTELVGGSWELADFGATDLSAAVGVIGKYADLRIGVADASLVVLAHRYATKTVATLDHRHFSVVRPIAGGRFTLVP